MVALSNKDKEMELFYSFCTEQRSNDLFSLCYDFMSFNGLYNDDEIRSAFHPYSATELTTQIMDEWITQDGTVTDIKREEIYFHIQHLRYWMALIVGRRYLKDYIVWFVNKPRERILVVDATNDVILGEFQDRKSAEAFCIDYEGKLSQRDDTVIVLLDDYGEDYPLILRTY